MLPYHQGEVYQKWVLSKKLDGSKFLLPLLPLHLLDSVNQIFRNIIQSCNRSSQVGCGNDELVSHIVVVVVSVSLESHHFFVDMCCSVLINR